MWIWVGPTWLRPGGVVARALFGLSAVVGVVMIVLAWTALDDTPVGAALFTLAVSLICAVNFRTFYLGRGRRAEAMIQALEQRD